MNRKEHLKLLEEKMKRNLEIARKKNNDYCGQGVEQDPFKNFKISEQAGVPVEQGILVRMYDKMARISSLLKKEAEVNDESVQDTLADLSNYALILSNYLDSKKIKRGKPLPLHKDDIPKEEYIGVGDTVNYIGNYDTLRGMTATVVDYSESCDHCVVKFGKHKYSLIPRTDLCLA